MRGWKTMSNRKQDPSLDKDIAKRVEDEWAQRFPNDGLEVFIIVTMMVFVSGGAYFMYILSQT